MQLDALVDLVRSGVLRISSRVFMALAASVFCLGGEASRACSPRGAAASWALASLPISCVE